MRGLDDAQGEQASSPGLAAPHDGDPQGGQRRTTADRILLGGRSARGFSKLIRPPHIKLESSHPSSRSATRGTYPFTGSRPFSTAKDRIKATGTSPIDWSLSEGW